MKKVLIIVLIAIFCLMTLLVIDVFAANYIKGIIMKVDCKQAKELVYNGAQNGTKVQVKLNFKNSESQGLGTPLPKGIVRVYKEDSSGQLQFVGEDQIGHTAKDEKVRLYLGDAFDIVGERTQTESANLSKGNYRDSYEIVLRNHKDAEQEVVIEEYAGSSWKITQKSDAFTQKDAYNIEFKVKVPANGEKKVTYTIEHQYYW